MILSKEHIRLEKQCNNCDCICDFCKDYDAYYNLPETCENDYFDTIEYLYTEMDKKEIAHEKARHEVEQERDRLKKLSELQKEYIDFLCNEIDNQTSFLMVHGMTPSDSTIKKGISLRKQIMEARNVKSI